MQTSILKRFAGGFTAALLALALTGVPAGAAVINGVAYTFDKAPSTSYPDNDLTKLTDGVRVPPSSTSTGFADFVVGWIQNPADPGTPHPTIDFSLGDVYDLTSVEISYALWPGAGVRAPEEVWVSFSPDGVNFGPAQAYTGFDGSNHPEGFAVFSRLLEIDLTGHTASFVRLDFRQGPGTEWGENRSAWHMLDEVQFTGTVIPEPGVIGLVFGLAAGGLLIWRRRKNG